MAKKVNKYLVNSNHFQQEKRRRSFTKGIAVFLVIIIVFIILYFIAQAKISTIEGSYQGIYRPDIQDSQASVTPDENGHYSLLVMAVGEEREESNYVPRVQLIEQITVNTTDDQATRVIIPHNTVPSWDDQGLPLSHVYTEQGITSVIQRTEEIMSVDYDHVVTFNLPNIRPLIEELGGITVEFPSDLEIDGTVLAAGERVNLSGLQVEQLLEQLSQANALEYRYAIRGILDGLISEIFNPSHLLNMDQYLETAQLSIQTDFPFENLKYVYLGNYNSIFEDITEMEMEGRRSSNEYGEVIELSPTSLDLIHELSN
ncbi:LCP family protein [Aerococcaceae bacterium DSM 111176]|nr:LCP family protein [Aerococcaceae bacterium DSM 111176]